jgi:hypothetical protein
VTEAEAHPSRHEVFGDVPAAAPRAGALPIRLTDCLTPFWSAAPMPAGDVVNWSKAPLDGIEAGLLGAPDWERHFLTEAERYLDAMAALGFTAIVVDDLAHLVVHPWYPAELREKLASWAKLYRRLFALATVRGLAVFASSDFCFFNAAIDERLRQRGETAEDFFAASLAAALRVWPELAGVVLRIGESAGVDVAGAFVSRLSLRRPAEARRLLTRLLPLCEQRGKTLIFRTWTLGAYPIGDLLWNRRTWDAVFGSLDSPSLVVSLKYGDADFFRFLPLNPLFFHGPQRKLVELQCRREYEGMGEYPSFVGWLYERHLRGLEDRGANLAGVFAINAGGWAPFRQVPYCGQGSLWNELNVGTVAALAQGGTVEDALSRFCVERGIADGAGFRELLRLSDQAIEGGLYIREFAESPRYFRRVRIPPLVWVFWHNVSTGGLIRLLHRVLVRDTARAVAEGHEAVHTVEQMLALARRLGLDVAPFQFQRDTFRLLAWHREALLGVSTPETAHRRAALTREYQQRYPHGYRFAGDDGRALPVGYPLTVLMRLLLRARMPYRWPDYLHLNRPASRLLAGLADRMSDALPPFAGRQGMSPRALLR